MFSFGIVAPEIACRTRIYLEGEGHTLLAKWVWQLYLAEIILGAAGERPTLVFCDKEMECLLLVSLRCTHSNDTDHRLERLLRSLKFEAPLPVLPKDMHCQRPFHASLASPTQEVKDIIDFLKCRKHVTKPYSVTNCNFDLLSFFHIDYLDAYAFPSRTHSGEWTD
ncbi:hypothetical protein EUGRSUZ_A02504 [Eucalyptus grandis]|uniref:Uncharacterized protein n=2 Tax=Eucalyptus grandis TaxID=71139 RepID=A0ACC3M7D4_EUCGR|nr:hypothetical protein EUGRSUZ_A02504 [Eucalyptus grandis]